MIIKRKYFGFGEEEQVNQKAALLILTFYYPNLTEAQILESLRFGNVLSSAYADYRAE